jgi:hypothetical protein
MFSNLGDFGAERSVAQAIGFYLVYLVIIFVVVELLGIASGLMFSLSGSTVYSFGIGLGAIFSGIFSALIAFLILKKKDLLGNFSSIIYIIATFALGLLAGAFLGMIIPAFLSTRKKSLQVAQ